MLLKEPSIHYRISRSVGKRRSAINRILRSDREARRQFGSDRIRTERRSEERRVLRVPVFIQPVQVRGLSATRLPQSETLLAVTQNISLRGLGWVHDAPLPPQTQFVAEFDVAHDEPLAVLVEVCWTLQEDEFSFRSGGRIVGICRRVV